MPCSILLQWIYCLSPLSFSSLSKFGLTKYIIYPRKGDNSYFRIFFSFNAFVSHFYPSVYSSHGTWHRPANPLSLFQGWLILVHDPNWFNHSLLRHLSYQSYRGVSLRFWDLDGCESRIARLLVMWEKVVLSAEGEVAASTWSAAEVRSEIQWQLWGSWTELCLSQICPWHFNY